MRNIGGKKRLREEEVDFDYLFADRLQRAALSFNVVLLRNRVFSP
jgi:hypothetical protein